MSRTACALALILTAPALYAESVLLECVSDAWYSAATPKPEGASRTLKLIEPGSVILLAFRMAAIEHWKVEKAVVVLHLAEPSEPAELTVSLLDGAWNEASAKPPPHRDGSVTMEKPKPDGWISIPVPQSMVQVLVDGKATGLALTAAHASRIFNSRETIQYSPFLAVVGERPGVKATSGPPTPPR